MTGWPFWPAPQDGCPLPASALAGCRSRWRDLIDKLGAEHHSNQWRTTSHFRQAAIHIMSRERGMLRSSDQDELITSQMVSQLTQKAERPLR